MKLQKRVLALALAVLMLATLLAGCGSSASTSDAPASQPAGNPAEGTAPQGQQAKEITIGYNTTVDAIGPFLSYGDVLTEMRFYIWEYLAVMDNEFTLQPSVAESWETTDGGLTYDFKLYDYVTDSAGNKITADDVVFSYNTFKESGRSNEMSNVSSIEALDEYTVRMVLASNAIGTLEDALLCPIVSKAAYEASSDSMAIDPVGTGRYVVESFEPGSSIVLVKREDYWQKEELISYHSNANIDKITFKLINDASQCAISLETGDVDLVLGLPMTTVSQYIDNELYKVEIQESQGVMMYMSGDAHSPLSRDQKLRQAVAYAIDNDAMVNICTSGYGMAMYDFSTSSTGDFNPAWKDQDYYTFNVDKAKALVEESDYNGETIQILVPSMDTWKRYAQVIQGYLLAVGINAEVYDVQSALYSTSFRDPTQYDLVLNPSTSVYTVQMWLRRLGQTANNGSTVNGFVDDKLQELIEGCSYMDNHTPENIDACHAYLKDQAYVYGLFSNVNGVVYRADGPVSAVTNNSQTLLVDIANSTFR